MLIWETPLTDARALAALAPRAAECLAREDGAGSLILCERGVAPRSVRQRRLAPLFSAGRAGPGVGRWLFRVGLWTPKDWREEFLAWYRYEHGPILLECPEWKGYRFFEERTARGCQFWVLHYLAERSALDSGARKRSRSTPWFRRLAKNRWFDGAFKRLLCRRIALRR